MKMSDDEVAAASRLATKIVFSGTTAHSMPPISITARPSPITARTTRKSKPPTSWKRCSQDEGIVLRRIIGPHTKHSYEPDAKRTIDDAVTSIVEVGRERKPAEIHFVTYTLRYNHMNWVQIDGLAEHWDESHATPLFLQPTTNRLSASKRKT